jgi:nucleoside-diphosphate-sugar epimerase
MKALVTGGGGFLGGAICAMLRAQGAQVKSLARGNYPELDAKGVECVRGSINDKKSALAACAGCDTVFHVAAKVGMWGSYEDFKRINADGTKTMLEAARESGVKKFIHTSTPSVVFPGGDVEGWREDAPYPARFDSHYAKTKALAEQLVLQANSPDLATVALRPHLVWGPGKDQLVSTIIAQGKAGKLRRIGNFNKLIDTTYIDDAARAHLCAAGKLAPGAACAGKAYFISQDDPRPNWDIINMILKAAGLPPVTKTVNHAAAYAAACAMEAAWGVLRIKSQPRLTRFVVQQLTSAHWFNISAARRDLGYAPSVTIEQGMEKLAEWFKNNKEIK